MKYLFFCLSVSLLGQTRVNPTAVDLSATAVAASIDYMNTQLTNTATSLAVDLDSTATVISVESVSGIGQNAALKIEGEHVQVVSISGNDITVTRGANGTTAAAHGTGTTVQELKFRSLAALAKHAVSLFFRQLVSDYPPVVAQVEQVIAANAAALEAARTAKRAIIDAAVQ